MHDREAGRRGRSKSCSLGGSEAPTAGPRTSPAPCKAKFDQVQFRLNFVHSSHLSGEGRAIFKRKKNQFEDLLLHGRPKELTTSSPNSCPKVCGELLRVLMLQDQLGHTSLSETSSRSGTTSSAFFFKQLQFWSNKQSKDILMKYYLAIDESDKLPLHWSGQSRADGRLQLQSKFLHTPARSI